MTHFYASITFFQFTFFISSFFAGEILDSSSISKSNQLENKINSDLFSTLTTTQKVLVGISVYTFFKTQNSFVNYYLDYALSRGGGGGGGDDDWVERQYAFPIVSKEYNIIKEFNTTNRS